MTRVSSQIAQSTFFFFFAKLERMHVDEQLSAQPLSLATELSHRANYSSGLPDCA